MDCTLNEWAGLVVLSGLAAICWTGAVLLALVAYRAYRDR